MIDPYFDCPNCNSKVLKLFIADGTKKLSCSSCAAPQQKSYNVNLGQTVATFTAADGTKGKLTVGKSWEIEHRRMTPEGVVINTRTGRPAQY